MSKLVAYCVGGTGINIGALWKRSLKTLPVADVEFVALDTSMNNQPSDNVLEVLTPPNTRGGGKQRDLNRDIVPEFVKQMLVEHRPGDFNVVIYSAAGASGSTIGPMLVHNLMKQNIPVVSMVVLDRTSDKEHQNTLDTMRSLDGQRKHFNMPVVIDLLENDGQRTRGDMNRLAVDRLNLLSLFLTDANEEADFEDIQHLLNYSKVTEAQPALSRIEYYDAVTIDKRTGNAVANMSLYSEPDTVRNVRIGKAYRVTGIFHEGARVPNNTGELHMVLEHSTIMEQILQDIDSLEQATTATKSDFGNVRAKDVSSDADGDGMIW